MSRLTLVCAPAGYGKTTAIAAGCRMAGADPIWYRFDVLDHDALAFLGSLTDALRLRLPEFGQPILERLRYCHESPISVDQLAALFIAECVEHVQSDTLIVFDDYHEAADSSELNRALDRLLANAPANLRFAVLSRYDPAFSLGKMRLAGQINVIGVELLRFDSHQVISVLESRAGCRFEPEHIERLVHLTEGWPASVVLAGLALDWLDLDSLEHALADPRMKQDIYSYLAEQVYRNENDGTRFFLDRTCCLEHVTPHLANRIVGIEDAHTYLHHLAENRVFTFASEPGAYRYHNLFREFLRHQFVYKHGEAAFRALQAASAEALEAAGDVEMAVELLFTANEPALALEVLARAGEPGLDNFRSESLASWLQRLSMEMRTDEAWALLLSSQVHLRAGRLEAAVQDTDKAVHACEALGDGWGLYHALSARESAYFWMGDVDEQIATCEKALISAANDAQRFHTLLSLGSAAVDKRDWQGAEAALAAADALSAHASPEERVRARAIRALAAYTQGDYRAAHMQFPQVPSQGFTPILMTSMLNARGLIETGLGRYESARALYGEALAIAKRYALSVAERMVEDNVAVALGAQGYLEDGLAIVRRTIAASHATGIDPILTAYALSAEATLLRRLARMADALPLYISATKIVSMKRDPYVALDLAANLAFTKALAGHGDGSELPGIARVAQGMQLSFVALAATLFEAILMADARPQDSRSIFAECLPQQLRLGHIDLLTQELGSRPSAAVLAVTALDSPQDLASLLEALAVHWRFADVFKHLARTNPHLLAGALAGASRRSSDDVLREVLNIAGSIGGEEMKRGVARVRQLRLLTHVDSGPSVAIAVLTPREREVLALMANGLRNPQIAERLFLTNATVKTHVNHIFYKLGVSTRVQAILKYKESETAGLRADETRVQKLNPADSKNPA